MSMEPLFKGSEKKTLLLTFLRPVSCSFFAGFGERNVPQSGKVNKLLAYPFLKNQATPVKKGEGGVFAASRSSRRNANSDWR